MPDRAEIEAVEAAVEKILDPYSSVLTPSILAEAIVAALDRVRDARDDDDPTPAVTAEQVARANEMGRGGGTMRTRAARDGTTTSESAAER